MFLSSNSSVFIEVSLRECPSLCVLTRRDNRLSTASFHVTKPFSTNKHNHINRSPTCMQAGPEWEIFSLLFMGYLVFWKVSEQITSSPLLLGETWWVTSRFRPRAINNLSPEVVQFLFPEWQFTASRIFQCQPWKPWFYPFWNKEQTDAGWC